MDFTLEPLPFAEDALEPHISQRTVEFHYHKHHKGYMTKLDKALENDERRAMSLEQIMRTSQGGIFNNAAQVWNHSFYWQSIAPSSSTEPSAGALRDQIERDFGSVAALKKELHTVAAGAFGSGWAWLVFDRDKKCLQVISISGAENPLSDTCLPLLTIDVWEHAYYLDYQNDRGAYLDAVLDKLINWEFAEANFGSQGS